MNTPFFVVQPAKVNQKMAYFVFEIWHRKPKALRTQIRGREFALAGYIYPGFQSQLKSNRIRVVFMKRGDMGKWVMVSATTLPAEMFGGSACFMK